MPPPSPLLSILLYWLTSTTLLFTSSHLFHTHNFPISTLTFLQSLTSAITLYCLPYTTYGKSHFTIVPKTSTLKKTLPMSIIFTLLILLNNTTLSLSSTSFYIIPKTLNIPFNCLTIFVLEGRKTDRNGLICILTIIYFFLLSLGSEPKNNYSHLGTIAGIASSLFIALNATITKRFLPILGDDHWKGEKLSRRERLRATNSIYLSALMIWRSAVAFYLNIHTQACKSLRKYF